MFVAPEWVKYWDQKDAFGLGDKLREAHADIREAGNCLALQQSTAFVFHLMRSLEVAVRHLARRGHIRIEIGPKKAWRQITKEMSKKIGDMPDATYRQMHKKNAWQAAAATLDHVGSCWRNKTMHPAISYMPSQARDIFEATRVFMTALCEL